VTGATALPVAIVTGFLGSGKTTFVAGLLTAGGGTRVAVIVNELGELGIDGALLKGAAQSVTELPGGCMCCESRGDVGRALALLATRASELDAIVVETSGVSDPLGVADLLAHGVFPTDLRLSQVVTVVDAENFDRNLADAEAAYSQIVSADLFVVGKSDLVAPEVVTAIDRPRWVRPVVVASRLGALGGRIRHHDTPPSELTGWHGATATTKPTGRRRWVSSPVYSAELGALDLGIGAPSPPDLLPEPGMRIGEQNTLCR
jgi:Ni2+-binding GTPase involved in maturation of urease and hydrogenase